jgi:UDP-3-O-[3-hydroxymyristoyl] glucosamine N-acyltransferase
MTSRTLQEIALICGASLEGDGTQWVEGLATLAEAGPRHVGFLANPRYRAQLDTTRACAVLVALDLRTTRADIALLRCADPNRSWTALIRAFTPAEPRSAPGIHPSAVVAPDASVDASASLGAHCSVGAGARVGARCVLQAGAVVGSGAVLGDDSELGFSAKRGA